MIDRSTAPLLKTLALFRYAALTVVVIACNTQPRDVIALLPTVVAGRTVTYQVEHGLDPFGEPGPITAVLAKEGRSPDDLMTARAELNDPHLWVMAFRAPGVPPGRFVDFIAGDLDRWTDTIGDKSVMRVAPSGVDHSRAGYLYVAVDTMVWIEAEVPAQAVELLQQLP